MIAILRTVENIELKFLGGSSLMDGLILITDFSEAKPVIGLQKQKYALLGGNGNITEI